MLPLFTMNTISKPIESDQNANGKQGTGGEGGSYKKFQFTIDHALYKLTAFGLRVGNQWL